ncbi:MAG: hypothetical protein R3B81_14810 [bacterium]
MTRFTFGAISCWVAILVSFSPALALERAREFVLDPSIESPWIGSETCEVRYFNICTGWVWYWAAQDGDRSGTVFETCHPGCEVVTARAYFIDRGQTGRGYTALLGLYAVDENDCPQEPPLASVAYIQIEGWQMFQFGGVPTPSRFALMATHASPIYWDNAIGFVSDHPGAGPTGPVACGTCYPADRVTHSYDWGNRSTPVCPGELIESPVCPAEFLLDVQLSCTSAVSENSWSRVRSMFR